MKLQQFDGGVSSRLAPQLLTINQGVVYQNIDNTQGILTPVKDKVVTDKEVERYHKYFVAEGEWLSSPRRTDFLEFQRRMYLTDGIYPPQKYSKGEYNLLGIKAPFYVCDLFPVNEAIPLKDITVLNKVSTGDLPASDFDYLLFNINDGVMSTPFKFTVYASTTATTKANGEVVSLDSVTRFGRNPITTTPGANRAIEFSKLSAVTMDEAKLYRYHNDLWYLVGTFATKDTIVLDDVFDISGNEVLQESNVSPFNGTYQYVYTYYNKDDGSESAPNAPSEPIKVESGGIRVRLQQNSNDPQVTHKRIYRVGGNLAKFTMVAEVPNDTYEYIDNLGDEYIDGRLLVSQNFYEAPVGLQYLTEAYAMLFGALGSSLRFTPVGKPDAWPPEFEIQFEADITGIGAVANGILVFTRFKTFIVTGTGPASLVQQPLRGDQGCIAFESIREVEAGAIIWASLDGLCTSSGNNVTNLTKNALGSIDLEPVSSIVYDEVYYCHNADGSTLVWDFRFQPIVRWLDLDIQALTKCCSFLYGFKEGKLYLLYKDTNNLSMSYKSPLLVEGSFSGAKTYKKVYIRSEGDIMINILIDKNVVASVNLQGTETHQIQVPQMYQRGYSIQFEVSGTGTVNEIEYVAGSRQNG